MSKEVVVKVDKLKKYFSLPHQQVTSLKSVFTNPFNIRSGFSNERQKTLDGISFDIKKGEFLGIVGKNGSGKSTLLKCIAGVYSPDGGKITVNGKLVPFIELGVGFNPELSGRDNIFLNGALLGFSKQDMQDMYQDIVDFAELEKFMDQKLKNYSSGMQVRLAFSIAIRSQGDILLLDEVLAVGDSAFQKKCNDYFEDIRESDATVVLVTHNMGAVERYCDRAILIDNGEIVKEGKPNIVADEYRNMNLVVSDAGKPRILEKNDSLIVKIEEQTKDYVKFSMKHKEDEGDYYFGFSVVKDGMTFAELSNMKLDEHRIKNKKLTYMLPLKDLNPGVYEVSATLFTDRDRRPVAYTKKRPQFMLKGHDPNRGSALRLDMSFE